MRRELTTTAVVPATSARMRPVRLSGTLSLYLARQVLLGIGIMVFALGALAYIIDVVELLRRAGDHEQATLGTVLLMAGLHLPLLMQKLMPFAVLFGTILSFQRLNRSQELIAARAIGVSVWQFLTPALAVAFGLGTVIVVAFNPLASATFARYEQLEARYLSSRSSVVSVSAGGLWLRQVDAEGELLIHARQMQRDPPLIEDVVLFQFDEQHQFASRVDAPSAELVDGQWRLARPLLSRPDGTRELRESLLVPSAFTPEGIQQSFAPPATMSFWDLPHFIESLEAVGFSAREHRLYLHGLLALPLLLSAMLLIGTTFSLRVVRRGGTGVLMVGALVTGFVFYVLSDVVFAVGLSGRLPVVLAAWTPAGVTILLGLTTLFHLEDG
jgi:lipopolysaccharide export system permease protein